MLLMTMHHVSPANSGKDGCRNRIKSTTAHIPGIPGNAYTQLADGLFAVLVAKRQQLRGDNVRHVSRQLVDVPLRATDGAPVFVKQRRDDVENVRDLIHSFPASHKATLDDR